jgi:hypothetical protein
MTLDSLSAYSQALFRAFGIIINPQASLELSSGISTDNSSIVLPFVDYTSKVFDLDSHA